MGGDYSKTADSANFAFKISYSPTINIGGNRTAVGGDIKAPWHKHLDTVPRRDRNVLSARCARRSAVACWPMRMLRYGRQRNNFVQWPGEILPGGTRNEAVTLRLTSFIERKQLAAEGMRYGRQRMPITVLGLQMRCII